MQARWLQMLFWLTSMEIFVSLPKPLSKSSYIKTKQKIKFSVFQTSENSTIAVKYQPPALWVLAAKREKLSIPKQLVV